FQSFLKGSNSYGGGTFLKSANGGSSWAAFADDAWFRAYVAPQVYGAGAGTLISSVKDASQAAGGTPRWTTLGWTSTTPVGAFAPVFQVAGANTAGGPFNFVGPDGTANTFFTTTASLSQFNGNRYLAYKTYLSTFSNFKTPTLSDVTVCFNNSLGF